jgi:hypothetical protein
VCCSIGSSESHQFGQKTPTRVGFKNKQGLSVMKNFINSGKLSALLSALLTAPLLACGGAADQLDSQMPAVSSDDNTSGQSGGSGSDLPVGDAAAPAPAAADAQDDAQLEPAAAISPSSNRNETSDAAAEAGVLSKVQLRFEDASVPPEYHRSYTISVQPSQLEVTVDVYGEVIAGQTHSVTTQQWDELLSQAAALPQSLSDEAQPEGVTGGSAHTLSLWTGGTTPKELTWSSASAPGAATTKAATTFVNVLRALVPDLQKLLDTEYPL